MKERPILFNDAMVRAILDGRKTQTRRIVKFPKGALLEEISKPWMRPTVWLPEQGESVLMDCPYGQTGDRLWVRETWQAWHEFNAMRAADIPEDAKLRINYPANGNTWDARMRPSIHMPRWASRITLEITGVRVEQLQDISEADAQAEGIAGPYDVGYSAYQVPGDSKPRYSTAAAAFETLWDSINSGSDAWDANPWVWVIEFQKVPA